MAAKFLVNKLSEDKLSGETDQVSTIFHNLTIIGNQYKEGFLVELKEARVPYVVQICICGRFVTYIEVATTLKEGLMRFYDFSEDMDAALDAAKEIKERLFSPFYSHWFMEEAYKLKEVYKDNYDAAELILADNAGLVLN